MTFNQKERIAFALIAGVIIVVGASTAVVASGGEFSNEYRMGVVVYTIFVSFVSTLVFGRGR
jgi:uncharacterized membrane protein